MRNKLGINNEPFIFNVNGQRGKEVWTLKQFYEVLKNHPEYKEFEKYVKEWSK